MTLFVSIVTIFISEKKNSFILKTIIFANIKEKEHQNLAIIAIVTFLVSIILGFIEFLKTELKTRFSKMILEISFKHDGRKKSIINIISKREPEVDIIEIEYSIVPSSRFIMSILKKSKFKVKLFFNPKYIDMNFENDSEWLGENNTKWIDDNSISFNILEQYEVDSRRSEKFIVTEKIAILPMRTNKFSTSFDYNITSDNFILNLVLKFLYKENIESLTIKSEGIVNEN